jgi:hypothetical protein
VVPVAAVLEVVIVLVYGYVARPGWVGVADKKFWDSLDLLIVPTAIAIGIAVINGMQNERQRQAQQAQEKRERRAEEDRRTRELEVENQRAQDAAFQAYLDQMSQLLTDKDRPLKRSQPGDGLRSVARTLTMLPGLDGERKRRVVRFLYESGLIVKDCPILNLWRADLIGTIQVEAYLPGADLSGASWRRGA